VGELSGVRVLDVSTLYPAPLLAALLGDLGADVVKVEPPRGDPLREMGAGPWSITGRNKRSVVADLDSDEGVSLLHRLVAASDVVVFNQPSTVLQRWQCTDAAVLDRNRDLVVVHVSCFGSTGPYADRPGNGTLAEAFIGLPDGTGVPLGDTVGAMHGVGRVVAALFARERGAGGRVVDVALYEALLPLVAPRRGGADTARMVRARFTAGDGREIAIAATTSAQRERLTSVAGEDVHRWVASRTSTNAVDALVAARVPAVVVGECATPAPSGTAPALGEHTAEVVREWLDEGI
jgi:formyl-CoA transferase